MGRFEHAHALLAIGVRSCGAESMLLSERMAFFQCVSFSLCRFFLSVSRIPSGHWQLKISIDCALQSSKPSLCRVHSWPAPQVAPALTPCLPSFVLLCGSRRRRVRPAMAAPLVCASLLVATHRAPPRPLPPTSQLYARPCLVVSCRFAPARCLTIRAGLERLVCRSSGFFSALPASSTPADTMAFRARARKAPPPRQHGQHPGVGFLPPGPLSPLRPIYPCLVATPFLALSCFHAVPRCPYPPPCYPQPAIVSLCFLTRSRSPEMAAS